LDEAMAQVYSPLSLFGKRSNGELSESVQFADVAAIQQQKVIHPTLLLPNVC